MAYHELFPLGYFVASSSNIIMTNIFISQHINCSEAKQFISFVCVCVCAPLYGGDMTNE